MTEPDSAHRRQVQGDVAALAGTIEEPSNFAVALEAGAPRD